MFRWLMFAAAPPGGTQGGAGGQGVEGAAGGVDALIRMIIPFALVFAVFYFILIRPQQQQQRRHEEMLRSLSGGERVVTAGGLIGKVLKVRDDVVTLELAKGLKVEALRGSITRVLKEESPKGEDA